MLKNSHSFDNITEVEWITLLNEASIEIEDPGREMLMNPSLPLTLMDPYIKELSVG
jgi:hypothetical protein